MRHRVRYCFLFNFYTLSQFFFLATDSRTRLPPVSSPLSAGLPIPTLLVRDS